MLLSFADIVGKDDRPPHQVDTPEWGDGAYVLVVAMSCDDRDLHDQRQTDKLFPDEGEADWRGLRAWAIGRCLCDEGGVVTPLSDLQVLELGKKNGAALDRIYQKIREISGLGAAAEEEAEKK